jgi:dephospho-CoA kinase
MPIDRKSARADRLIDNSGPREKTREQVDAIMKELTGLASSTDLAHN